LFSYSKLGQNEDPEFTFRVMVISTNWPGATALELSEQVVDKIERKLQDTPFVDKIRSYAKPGQSLTFVVLKGAVPPK
ncbi:efflux RND transporter permease subunit, partial [Acinetobacter baumannii]